MFPQKGEDFDTIVLEMITWGREQMVNKKVLDQAKWHFFLDYHFFQYWIHILKLSYQRAHRSEKQTCFLWTEVSEDLNILILMTFFVGIGRAGPSH